METDSGDRYGHGYGHGHGLAQFERFSQKLMNTAIINISSQNSNIISD